MDYIRHLLLLIACGLAPVATNAADAPIRVALLNPATPANPFWEKLTNGVRFAAEDFGMQLQVQYMDNEEITSRFAYVEAARALTRQRPRPDYVLFMNLKGSGHRMLRIFEDAGIRSLIINSDFHPEEQAEVGKPRGKFRHWIGQLTPDDEGAGYLLAERLLEVAPGTGELPARRQVIGIGGAVNGTAAELRDQGLKQALQDAGSELVYGVNSRTWLREDGYLRAINLMHRYPQVRIYWAAADNLALGVRDAARELAREGVIVGGIDWTDAGLTALANGDLQVSVGGHVLEGILALTLIHDHHQGHDFAAELGTVVRTRMHAAHAGNLVLLRAHLADASLRADDFRRLSRAENPKLKRYDLSIANLLRLPAEQVAPTRPRQP